MIKLGTRRSALATAQATLIADALRNLGHEVELVLIVTTGDVNRGPLEQIVGTGSPRRVAQLDALGLGLECTGIRGNVDTRIAMVTEGKLDAVVLARAGLSRLGRLAEVTETLDPIQVLPAPGQGALGIECRADDAEVLAALAPLEDPATRAAVTAERQLLATLEAGCTAPVGALAEVVEGEDGPELWLRGALGREDGVRRLSANGPVE